MHRVGCVFRPFQGSVSRRSRVLCAPFSFAVRPMRGPGFRAVYSNSCAVLRTVLALCAARFSAICGDVWRCFGCVVQPIFGAGWCHFRSILLPFSDTVSRCFGHFVSLFTRWLALGWAWFCAVLCAVHCFRAPFGLCLGHVWCRVSASRAISCAISALGCGRVSCRFAGRFS